MPYASPRFPAQAAWVLLALGLALSMGGCRYYGSAVPPENPISMRDALRAAGGGGDGANALRVPTRPAVERPSYLPEKELALVAPPQTLLVWTYPHVTDDNTRVFGNWSTIFLTDRYEWARPANQLPPGADDAGVPAGRPNLGANEVVPFSNEPQPLQPISPQAMQPFGPTPPGLVPGQGEGFMSPYPGGIPPRP